jgi:hypothetical protein
LPAEACGRCGRYAARGGSDSRGDRGGIGRGNGAEGSTLPARHRSHSGCGADEAGGALNTSLISSRLLPDLVSLGFSGVAPLKTAIRSSARSVCATASRGRRSTQRRVSSYSVKISRRLSAQTASPVCSPGTISRPTQSSRWLIRASGAAQLPLASARISPTASSSASICACQRSPLPPEPANVATRLPRLLWSVAPLLRGRRHRLSTDGGKKCHGALVDALRRARSSLKNTSQRRLVDSKGSRKRLDRRQEPLLQADPDEFSLSATTDGFTLQPPAAQLAVIRPASRRARAPALFRVNHR